MGIKILVSVAICACLFSAKSTAQNINQLFPIGPPIACVGTPGNTTGAYRQQCQALNGTVYNCKNLNGCQLATDWTTTGGAGIPCVGTPGNTPGTLFQSCITSSGLTYICLGTVTTGRCAVSGDWTLQPVLGTRILTPTNSTDYNWFDTNYSPTGVTGHFNFATGLGALASLTSGADNFAQAYFALNLLTTGSQNYASGLEACEVAISSVGLMCIGYNAGQLATGSLSQYIGYASGSGATTATAATCTGAQTCGHLLGALNVTVTGEGSLVYGSGNNITLDGFNMMPVGGNGTAYTGASGYNTCSGAHGMYQSVWSSYNSCTGEATLYNDLSTNKSIAMGYLADYLNAGQSLCGSTACVSPTNTTATLNSTTTIVVANSSGIANGQAITGTGIPASTTVTSISGAPNIVISNAATTSASGVAVSFSAAGNNFYEVPSGNLSAGVYYYKMAYQVSGPGFGPVATTTSEAVDIITTVATGVGIGVYFASIPPYGGPLTCSNTLLYRTTVNQGTSIFTTPVTPYNGYKYQLAATISGCAGGTYTDTLADSSLVSNALESSPSQGAIFGVAEGTLGNFVDNTCLSNMVCFGTADVPYNYFWLGQGMYSPTPSTNVYIGVTGGSGTNVQGSNIVYNAGWGTGAAPSGSHIFQGAVAGSSGSQRNDVGPLLTLGPSGATFTIPITGTGATLTGDLITDVTGMVQCGVLASNGKLTGSGAPCNSGTAAGANVAGYYVVTQSTNEPPNAVSLGSLGSGYLYSTVSGGVSALSNILTPPFLPLGGGTLTGGLIGTTGAFSGALTTGGTVVATVPSSTLASTILATGAGSTGIQTPNTLVAATSPSGAFGTGLAGIAFTAVTPGIGGNNIGIVFSAAGASPYAAVSGNQISVGIGTPTACGGSGCTAAQVLTVIQASTPASALVTAALTQSPGSSNPPVVGLTFLTGGSGSTLDSSGDMVLAGSFTVGGGATTSTSSVLFDAQWITSGATVPTVLIRPYSAALLSSAWNSSGVGLGIQTPPGFGGYPLQILSNNVSQFSVSANGTISNVGGLSTQGAVSAIQYSGPASAPSGTCSSPGVWEFTQDGHATFCQAGTPDTWVTKI